MNNLVCVVARLVFLFRCAVTTGRCNAFQRIFVNHICPYFQTMLFLVTMMRGGDFIFDWVYLLYYKCHKITPNCG